MFRCVSKHSYIIKNMEIMEFLVLTGNIFGKWTGNRKFIGSGLIVLGIER